MEKEKKKNPLFKACVNMSKVQDLSVLLLSFHSYCITFPEILNPIQRFKKCIFMQ